MSDEKSDDESRPNPLLKAAEIAAQATRFGHPWNPNSEIIGTRLSRLAGLTRASVTVGRIPPGKESFLYHSHQFEEEWMYILAGRGMADIGDEELEVGPGDFLGFPAPSVGHHLRNPFAEDLVYLSGGERRDLEVAEFPRIGKHSVRFGRRISLFDSSAAERFPGVSPLISNGDIPGSPTKR